MIRAFGIVLSVGLLALCGPADADCNRNRAVFCPQIVVPTYTTAVATPYVATTVVTPLIEVVPVAVPIPVVNDFYYSLQPYITERERKLLADDIAASIQGNVKNQKPSKTEAVVPDTIKPSEVSSVLIPGGDEPPPGLAKVVGDACIRCHSAAKASGGLDLSNLKAVPKLIRAECFRRVNNGSMPKGGTPLPDEQAKLFDDWTGGFRPAVASR